MLCSRSVSSLPAKALCCHSLCSWVREKMPSEIAGTVPVPSSVAPARLLLLLLLLLLLPLVVVMPLVMVLLSPQLPFRAGGWGRNRPSQWTGREALTRFAGRHHRLQSLS